MFDGLKVIGRVEVKVEGASKKKKANQKSPPRDRKKKGACKPRDNSFPLSKPKVGGGGGEDAFGPANPYERDHGN